MLVGNNLIKDQIISFLKRRKDPRISRLFMRPHQEIMVICEGLSDASLLRKIQFPKGVVFVPAGFLHTDDKGELLVLNSEDHILKSGKNRVLNFLKTWSDDYAIVDMDDDLNGSLLHKRVVDSRNATLLFGRILDAEILKKEITNEFNQIHIGIGEESVEHCFAIAEFFGKQKVGNKSLNSIGKAYKPEKIFSNAKDFQMLVGLAQYQNEILTKSIEAPPEISFLNDHALECSLKFLYLDKKGDTNLEAIGWQELKDLKIQVLDGLFYKSFIRSVKRLKLDISPENQKIVLSEMS